MGITAETKVKHHKNGNTHKYTYYRCTRKNKAVKCADAPVRSEVLDAQLSNLLGEYAMPSGWVSPLLQLLDQEAATASQAASGAIFEMRTELDDLTRKIARLTDLYLVEDIQREEYLLRKRELTTQRRSLEENILRLEHTPTLWVEPVRNWILNASRLGEIAKSEDYASKKSALQNIFGLNLTLHAREARGIPFMHWRELHSAGAKSGKIQESLIWVGLLNHARTYFTQHPKP